MKIALVGSALIASLLALACAGDDGAQPASRTEQGERSAPVERFVLVSGGPFRVCVQTLDESVSLEQAASAIQAGFEAVAGDGRWPHGWDAPDVDRGCPLPPLALTETDRPFLERRVCEERNSGYLVHLYVGDGARFEERFADSRLRVAPHEYLAVDGAAGVAAEDAAGDAQCFGWVSLAWYVTPDELDDDAVLGDYVSNFVGELH